MSSLTVEDFASFFHALHGRHPFPWQQRLAETVATVGWPDALDIPTGSGKTAAIDVAVFTLALQARLGIDERRAPVRIAFIVDRRLVVDEAFDRARRIAAALRDATGNGILARVAGALRCLAEADGPPLAVARLRGGLPREPDWARTPAQPTVLVSTVDQVGSRLLFRGYGVSPSMRPIHAGLLGRDVLVLLDEAHLSRPFLQTLRDLADPPWGGRCATAPFHVVPMTATPEGATRFRLTDEDRADPVLSRRLTCGKPVTLVGAAKDALETTCIEHARRLARSARLVGIVVNRVRRARAIYARLASQLGEAADVALLIGRTREIDREDALLELLPRMRAGRTEDGGRTLFVVATQCIEAGADLDFDAMITEIAPLDCLRQRFGRLNRMGRHDSAPGAIVATADQIGARAQDPIYGTALRDTWSFLKGIGNAVDFGIKAADAWLPEPAALAPLLAPRVDAPLLLPRDARLWKQTAPPPVADPAVSLYLHGPDSSPADVQIVWRKELDPDDIESWAAWIEACPPVPGEAMAIPLGEARRWLAGSAIGDVADVEGRSAAAEDQVGRGQKADVHRDRSFRIWRDGEVLADAVLRPGDTVLVPCLRGGADRWGWHPASTIPVADVADRAMERAGRQRVIRLTSDVIDAATREAYLALSDVTVLRDLRDRGVLAANDPADGTLIRGTDGAPLVVVLAQSDAASEDDRSSLTANQPRCLVEHTDGVWRMTESFADRLGLDADTRQAVLLAARLHDAGKAHPAFQRYLYGGDELAAAAGTVLAKSGRVLTQRHRRQANLPDGARHEVASLRAAEAHPDFAAVSDPELVLWLIGTHHGFGRPLFPPVAWPEAGEVFCADTGDGHGAVTARPALPAPALTARWLALSEAVHRRHGPWRLAHLEAVLRLADHRQSEAERTA